MNLLKDCLNKTHKLILHFSQFVIKYKNVKKSSKSVYRERGTIDFGMVKSRSPFGCDFEELKSMLKKKNW